MTATKIEKYDYPFEHYMIENFLPEESFKIIYKKYSKTKFYQKYTDLFSFYQSDEIRATKEFGLFFKNLDNIFNQIDETKDYWYNGFCSYYNEGDYLLCHDDRVEFRKYAFSFYLEDFDSGELMLYNEDFSDKKILKVRRNVLVIFRVSDVSFHEVNYCFTSGRKAITGWFNTKDSLFNDNQGKERNILQKIAEENMVELEIHPNNKFTSLPNMIYEYEIIDSKEEIPFTNRRMLKLSLRDPLLIKIKGYTLMHYSFYKVRKFDYLLLNDPINNLESENILDLFCFHGKNRNLVFLDEEGNEVNRIIVNDGSWLVERNGMKFFVENGIDEFFMAHFIYLKE